MSDQGKPAPKTITPTWDGEKLTVPVPTDAGEYVVAAVPIPSASATPSAGTREHPAPWRWGYDEVDKDNSPVLRDDRGPNADYDQDAEVLWLDSPLPGRHVRELIRLAPEMEQALRYFVGLVGNVRPAHPELAKAIRILDVLDATRTQP